MENNEKKEYTQEELAAIITKNQFMTYAIRIMSGLKIDDESQNEVELYKKIAGAKKTEIPVVKGSTGFYTNLFTTGYDAFGAEFFIALQNTAPEHLYSGIIALLEALDTIPEVVLKEMHKKLEENVNHNIK